MAIQVLQDAMGLGQALPQIGASLGQGFQKRGERRDVLSKEKRAQAKQAQSGSILQQSLGQLGPNASLQEVQGALAQAIQAGADPSIVNQFGQQFAPLVKEKARTQGAQSFLQQIMNPQGNQHTGSFQEEGMVSTPQGTIYEQIDGVPDGITQSKIDALMTSPYPEHQALGKSYDDKRKESRKNFVDDRAFHAKGLQKTEEKIEKLREALPKRERVLNLARQAIESNEIGAFSRNRIADLIGGPIGDALRTKSGAQFGLAAKENLVTNMSEISARGINMFMEKRLLDAFSKVGQSQEANLAVQDFFEAENDIEKAYLKEYDRLREEDVATYGYPRNDLAKRARAASKDEQQKIFNRSSVRNRELQEKEKGIPWMYQQTSKKVASGTPLTADMYNIFVEKIGDPKSALLRAKQLGYTIYPPSQLPGGA